MVKSPSELSTETLIKRVMSGKKEYRSHEYLTAFSHIPSNLLHCKDVSRTELIKLWNSLQKCSIRCPYMTFSLVHDNSLIIKTIEDIYRNEKYAYICHDKDKNTEHKHYHYVLLFNSPRSLKAIANDLSLPYTMIEKVYSKRGILDYLTHENDPNKYHYSLNDIHANFDVSEEKEKEKGDPELTFIRNFRIIVLFVKGACLVKNGLTNTVIYSILCDIGSYDVG